MKNLFPIIIRQYFRIIKVDIKIPAVRLSLSRVLRVAGPCSPGPEGTLLGGRVV